MGGGVRVWGCCDIVTRRRRALHGGRRPAGTWTGPGQAIMWVPERQKPGPAPAPAPTYAQGSRAVGATRARPCRPRPPPHPAGPAHGPGGGWNGAWRAPPHFPPPPPPCPPARQAASPRPSPPKPAHPNAPGPTARRAPPRSGGHPPRGGRPGGTGGRRAAWRELRAGGWAVGQESDCRPSQGVALLPERGGGLGHRGRAATYRRPWQSCGSLRIRAARRATRAASGSHLAPPVNALVHPPAPLPSRLPPLLNPTHPSQLPLPLSRRRSVAVAAVVIVLAHVVRLALSHGAHDYFNNQNGPRKKV